MTDNGHAVLGPSSAKRWMTCTASVELIEKEGKHGTNAAAEEGTAAHTVLELSLLTQLVAKGHIFEVGRIHALSKEVAYLGRADEIQK